ncbi:MAG TPA: response regulator [Saprospiraceae bacterium]|nr:response regulator [Saprospiraceae bacterium]
MSQIKILIVEDEVLIARDIARTLKGIDYEVTGIAYDGQSALKELKAYLPDLAILDINLGGEPDGIAVAKYIQDTLDIPFIFLTSYASEMIIDKAKRTRPMGYIVKPFSEKDLFSAIEIALYNYSQLVHPLKFDMERINKQLTSPLSVKEYEIVCDIYEGRTNQQLTGKHFISMNTVKTHIRHIYEKLHVDSRSEAIVRLRTILSL